MEDGHGPMSFIPLCISPIFHFSFTFHIQVQNLSYYLKFSLLLQWWQVDRISPMKLQDESKQMGGLSLKSLLFKQKQTAFVRQCVEKVLDMYVKGQIKPLIDSTWAFDDVSDDVRQ